MLSSDFLFSRFFVVPLANPSNFSHCKCFSSRIFNIGGIATFLKKKLATAAVLNFYLHCCVKLKCIPESQPV